MTQQISQAHHPVFPQVTQQISQAHHPGFPQVTQQIPHFQGINMSNMLEIYDPDSIPVYSASGITPLFECITPLVRAKIKAGIFIDMNEIAFPPKITNHANQPLCYDPKTGQIVSQTPQSKTIQLHQVDIWAKAFSSYISAVIDEKKSSTNSASFLNQVSQMLDYKYFILFLAKEKLTDWLYYDVHFRRWQAKYSSSFGAVDMSILFTAKERFQSVLYAKLHEIPEPSRYPTGSTAQFPRPTSQSRSNVNLALSKLAGYSFPKGFCVAFLADLACKPDCPYKHWCPACDDQSQVHSLLRCPNPVAPSKQSKAPQFNWQGMNPPWENSSSALVPYSSRSQPSNQASTSFSHPRAQYQNRFAQAQDGYSQVQFPPPLNYPPPRF